jgi:hypothetical protein
VIYLYVDFNDIVPLDDGRPGIPVRFDVINQALAAKVKVGNSVAIYDEGIRCHAVLGKVGNGWAAACVSPVVDITWEEYLQYCEWTEAGASVPG